jgi:aminoglycoside phosphotransferase (APT) family kinase protein
MSSPAEWVPDAAETGPVGDQAVDWTGLEAHLRASLPGLRGELSVERFVRGGPHDAYRLRFGATLLVVRTFADPSQGLVDAHRALAAIARGYDRAPAPLLLCEDQSVAGVVFEVLQYQPGFVITDRLPNAFVREPDVGRRIAAAVVEALAELHALEGGPVHGSFSLAHCQFDADAEGGTPDRVTGVLGWDHARPSGPAAEDLRTLVASWPGEALGLPPGDELAAMYSAATGGAPAPADLT